MSRPADNAATIACALARVLSGRRPAWVATSTWAALHGALQALLADVHAVTLPRTYADAGRVLGLHAETLRTLLNNTNTRKTGP